MEKFVFLGANGYDWIKAIIDIVITAGLSKLVMWILPIFFRRFSKVSEKELKDILRKCAMPICLLIIFIGIRLSLTHFPLDKYHQIISMTYTVVSCLTITWFMSNVITTLICRFIASRNTDGKNNSAVMVPTIKHLLQVVIWGGGIAITLSNTGYDVKALLAGLGFGGVALALAAKNTVTNFLGGATLLIDNPFSIGDRVRVANYDGVVSFIGLRSFRLNTLDGTEVTIPNSNIIDNAVENVTREPARRIVLKLQLTYTTNAEQIELAMNTLKDIALNNPHVDNNCHVFFCDFAEYSLDIKFIYYIIKGCDIFGTQSEMNLLILNRFQSNGIHFAFPTHSLFVENTTNIETNELASHDAKALKGQEVKKLKDVEIKKIESKASDSK